MIKMSDKALKELVHYFEKVDEPTVIVFFGDHQPDLEETFYNRLLHTDIQKLEGEDLEQLYKVPFLIWANYDIKEENVEKPVTIICLPILQKLQELKDRLS